MTSCRASLTWSCPLDNADISPSITFSENKSQFFLYVTHNYTLPSIDDCIVVSFYRVLPMGGRPCQALCTISLVIRETGQKVRAQTSIAYFGQDSNGPEDGGVYLISRKCLIESGLVLEGRLTICCEVQVFDSVQRDLSLPALDSMETLRNCTENQTLSQYGSLLESGAYSDISFVIGEREFRLHKAILAAQSPMFRTMFKHSDWWTMVEMDNKPTVRIEVIDTGVKAFEKVVRFMYTGQVDSVDENTLELFVAADKYQLTVLKDICVHCLITKLSIESVASVLLLADMHNAPILKTKCVQYINQNASNVMLTDGWKQLAQEHNTAHLLLELYLDIVKPKAIDNNHNK